MANYGSDQVAFFLIGGYDLLGVTTRLEDEIERVLEETTTLGVAWQAEAPVGVQRATFKQNGYYDAAANASNDALVALNGSQRVLMWGVAGNAIGRPFTGAAGAIEAVYQRVIARLALYKANAEYRIAGRVEEGVILAPKAARTTSGDTQATSVDYSTLTPAIPITSSSVANPTTITTSAPHGLTSGDRVVIGGHSGSTPSINGEQTATVTSPTTFTIPVNVTAGGSGGAVNKASSQ